MLITDTLPIIEIPIPDYSNAVIIESNRWKPDRCMWVADKAALRHSDVYVVFPFPEMWRSVCHILAGENDEYSCFLHLTPLTSLFRRDTTELAKISANLKMMTGNADDWRFKIFYFNDDGREERFRSLIAGVLNGRVTGITQLAPDSPITGCFNLTFHNEEISYSLQEIETLAYKDVSVLGSFNETPIEAIE